MYKCLNCGNSKGLHYHMVHQNGDMMVKTTLEEAPVQDHPNLSRLMCFECMHSTHIKFIAWKPWKRSFKEKT